MPLARTYKSRYSGPVLLACKKCEKKLKPKLKLKKKLKLLNRNGPATLHLIQVSCMKLCPKGGIAICAPQQLASANPRLQILYTEQDLVELHSSCITAPVEF